MSDVRDKIFFPSNTNLFLSLKRDSSPFEVYGFTNGCFDVVHVGHLAFLRDAKKEAEKLVVGLNSDRSVRELKGNSRPINCEKDRALFLAHLDFIDYVIVFDERTPEQLIRKINPHVLIKGGDYEGQKISGADFVQKKGGKVLIKSFLDGYSSSRIIQKIREQ